MPNKIVPPSSLGSLDVGGGGGRESEGGGFYATASLCTSKNTFLTSTPSLGACDYFQEHHTFFKTVPVGPFTS